MSQLRSKSSHKFDTKFKSGFFVKLAAKGKEISLFIFIEIDAD